MKASIAIQILPQGVEEKRLLEIVDSCIELIGSKGYHYVVTPFETVIEGDDMEELLDIVKELQKLVVDQGAEGVATYIKLWYSPKGVLTIEEKVEKHKH
ncbi:MAG: thiamine-binding protein [Tissierellia bacterium]|nr:thiamine-binding protein [Tissierellia bacterium]